MITFFVRWQFMFGSMLGFWGVFGIYLFVRWVQTTVVCLLHLNVEYMYGMFVRLLLCLELRWNVEIEWRKDEQWEKFRRNKLGVAVDGCAEDHLLQLGVTLTEFNCIYSGSLVGVVFCSSKILWNHLTSSDILLNSTWYIFLFCFPCKIFIQQHYHHSLRCILVVSCRAFA